MIFSLLTFSLFHLGSIYLSYEDIKSRSVTLWVLIFTLIIGVISALPIAFTLEVFLSSIFFFAVVIGLSFINKRPVIAWADLFYIVIILVLIQDLWWLFFICIGLISIIFHYLNHKQKELPFIALLYASFIVTKLYALLL
jgi:hypothetical protein